MELENTNGEKLSTLYDSARVDKTIQDNGETNNPL
jgi:hypothetical protein